MKRAISVGFLLMVPLMCAPIFVNAQSIIWTDSFIEGQSATIAQCNAWHGFLDQLTPDKDFVSVTISGTFDPEGITIMDAAGAKKLANLLHTRTAGSVTSDGHTWYVDIGCNLNSCVPSGQGIELKVDVPGFCYCPSPGYTVRPDIGNVNWGGINTSTCSAPSQIMIVEFHVGETDNDSDDDGISNCNDQCPDSDRRPTVIIDGFDSGVANTMLSSGCTISDRIAKCADGAKNHGWFVSCVANLTNSLRLETAITGKMKGAVQRCAAKAHIP